jgi:hypothetical protein
MLTHFSGFFPVLQEALPVTPLQISLIFCPILPEMAAGQGPDSRECRILGFLLIRGVYFFESKRVREPLSAFATFVAAC